MYFYPPGSSRFVLLPIHNILFLVSVFTWLFLLCPFFVFTSFFNCFQGNGSTFTFTFFVFGWVEVKKTRFGNLHLKQQIFLCCRILRSSSRGSFGFHFLFSILRNVPVFHPCVAHFFLNLVVKRRSSVFPLSWEGLPFLLLVYTSERLSPPFGIF